MRRGVWFVAGAGAGIYAMVRGRRLAEAFTADGLQDRLHGLGAGARMFRDEVAEGYAEKETELRQRYGLVPDGALQIAGRTGGGRHRADALAAPTGLDHDPGTAPRTDPSTTETQEGHH